MIVVETHHIIIVDALHTHFRFVCCIEDFSFFRSLLLFCSFTILCFSTIILEIAQAISVGWLSILQELQKLIVIKVEMKAFM